MDKQIDITADLDVIARMRLFNSGKICIILIAVCVELRRQFLE
jgi:hypothetical protein